jgi:hypothetical protein
LVTSHRDGFRERGWRIEAGWALRGHASCDFINRILLVPLGSTNTDRIIRAHELMHARVSPHVVNPIEAHPELPQRALECAEEFRVNYLLARLGFDVRDLADGSERFGALRLSANAAWEEACCFFVAILGTGAEREFMKGIRHGAPQWVKPLGVIRRRVMAIASVLEVDDIASTAEEVLQADGSSTTAGLPVGFRILSVPVAQILARVGESVVPGDADQMRQFRRSLEPGGRRLATDRSAHLVFDESISYSGPRHGRTSRRPRPDVSGTTLRYPSRILTDPHQRAFSKSRPSTGGIVIVDQSGSMDIDEGDLDQLLRSTPGAVVIGYSHRPGDTSGRPNAWVLARDGQRATVLPSGNVGNGVDGPVLEWAASQRGSRDRIVWVTDGQVTDSNDHPSQNLSRHCAHLVRRHRVVMVRTLSAAIVALRAVASPNEDPTTFGRVGRALRDAY